MPIASLETCYQIADKLSDNFPVSSEETGSAINFVAYTAQMYQRNLKRLAWTCLEKNSAKRNRELQAVLAELEANDESLAELPMRERTAC